MTYTPAQVAKLIGVRKVDVIYAHIRVGRLAAVNVGTGDARPCWRITQAALDQFFLDRTNVPPPKPVARTRRRNRITATKYF